MRKLMVILSLLAVLALSTNQTAVACGDKLVRMSGGVLLQRAYMAARPVSILIYSGSVTKGKTTPEHGSLSPSLKRAGHTVRTVSSLVQLDQALRSEKFDLVLADVNEAAALATKAVALVSKPLVLPVLQQPTKAEIAAAEKQFGFALIAPLKATRHLEVVDLAMKSRPRLSSRS